MELYFIKKQESFAFCCKYYKYTNKKSGFAEYFSECRFLQSKLENNYDEEFDFFITKDRKMEYQNASNFLSVLQYTGSVPAALLIDYTTLKDNKNLLKLPWNVVFCIGSMDISLRAPRILDAEDFEDNVVSGKNDFPLVFFDEEKLSREKILVKKKFIREKLKILYQIGDCGLIFIHNIPKEYYDYLYDTLDSKRKNQKNIIILNGLSCIHNEEVVSFWKDNGQVQLFKESLPELWKTDEYDDKDLFIQDTEQCDNLFIDSKLIKIKSNTSDKIKHFGQLLTLESVGNPPMITSADEPTFFQHFLENSSGGFPNWFWYSGNPVFHVKRDIEKDILKAVQLALKNIESATRKGAEPILLQGQNLTGKTNILCSVAYQVFCEKKYPVIFLPSIGSVSEWKKHQEDLVFVLNELKEKNDSKTPVLLVWDTACENVKDYKSIIDIWAYFCWCGFKTVILCSGYISGTDDSNKWFDKSFNRNRFFIKPNLSSEELTRFEDVLINKKIFEKKDFNIIKDKYSAEPTFLASLYWMRQIRNKLRDHVSREVSSAVVNWQYIVKMVIEESIKKSLSNTLAIFSNEFAKLKFEEPTEDSFSKKEEDRKGITEESLKKAMGCLALCTIYSCPLNIELFVRIIRMNVDEIPTWELYKLCTHNNMLREITEMPSPAYQFRSVLEANLFLSSLCDRSCYTQFDMLLDLINAAFRNDEVSLLISLLTESGPNAKGMNEKRENIWAKFNDKYPDLWKLLAQKRQENPNFEKILPLEKSFIREWYRQNLHNTENPHSLNAFDDLFNSQKELLNAYENWNKNCNPFDDLRIKILIEYASTVILLLDEFSNKFDISEINFEKLKSSFLSIPYCKWIENSYIPTNFLNLGCRIYDKTLENEKKLEFLSQLTYFADSFSSEDVDENLEKAIQNVYTRMDDFLGNSEYLDKSTDAQKPSAISVRVRAVLRELENDGHAGYRKECIDQLLEDFLENPVYAPVIDQDAGCLWLLITLKWENLTKHRYILPCDNSEDLRVGLPMSTWEFFYNQCQKFMLLNQNRNIPFSIKFLRVLAYLHCKKDYTLDYNRENWLQEDDIRFEFGRKSLYLICDEKGTPLRFKGRNQFWDEKKRYGKIEITEENGTKIASGVSIRYYRPEAIGFTKEEAKLKGRISSIAFYLTLNQTGLKVEGSER